MAIDLGRWKPDLHPRDSKGRFRDKWGLSPRAMAQVDRLLAAFNPPPLRSDAHAASFLRANKGPRSIKQKAALDRFLTREGNENIQSTLRAHDEPTLDIRELDGMMQPLKHDLVVSRVLGPDAFGLAPEQMDGVEEWTGKLVQDAGYSPTNVGNAYSVAGPHVEMRILVPRGTRAIVVGDDGGPDEARTVILDREQPLRLGKIQKDERGGWYVMATIAPKQGAGKAEPARNLGRELPVGEKSPAIEATPDELARRGIAPDEGLGSPEQPGRYGPATPSPGAGQQVLPQQPQTESIPNPAATGPVAEGGPPGDVVQPAKAIEKTGSRAPVGGGQVVTKDSDLTPPEKLPSRSRGSVANDGTADVTATKETAAREKLLQQREDRRAAAEKVLAQREARIAQREQQVTAQQTQINELQSKQIQQQQDLIDRLMNQPTGSEGGTRAEGLTEDQRQAVLDRAGTIGNAPGNENDRVRDLARQINEGGGPAPAKATKAAKKTAGIKATRKPPAEMVDDINSGDMSPDEMKQALQSYQKKDLVEILKGLGATGGPRRGSRATKADVTADIINFVPPKVAPEAPTPENVDTSLESRRARKAVSGRGGRGEGAGRVIEFPRPGKKATKAAPEATPEAAPEAAPAAAAPAKAAKRVNHIGKQVRGKQFNELQRGDVVEIPSRNGRPRRQATVDFVEDGTIHFTDDSKITPDAGSIKVVSQTGLRPSAAAAARQRRDADRAAKGLTATEAVKAFDRGEITPDQAAANLESKIADLRKLELTLGDQPAAGEPAGLRGNLRQAIEGLEKMVREVRGENQETPTPAAKAVKAATKRAARKALPEGEAPPIKKASRAIKKAAPAAGLVEAGQPDAENVNAVRQAKSVSDVNRLAQENGVRIPSTVGRREDRRAFLEKALAAKDGESKADYDARMEELKSPTTPVKRGRGRPPKKIAPAAPPVRPLGEVTGGGPPPREGRVRPNGSIPLGKIAKGDQILVEKHADGTWHPSTRVTKATPITVDRLELESSRGGFHRTTNEKAVIGHDGAGNEVRTVARPGHQTYKVAPEAKPAKAAKAVPAAKKAPATKVVKAAEAPATPEAPAKATRAKRVAKTAEALPTPAAAPVVAKATKKTAARPIIKRAADAPGNARDKKRFEAVEDKSGLKDRVDKLVGDGDTSAAAWRKALDEHAASFPPVKKTATKRPARPKSGLPSFSGHDGKDVTDEEERDFHTLSGAEQDAINARIRTIHGAGGQRATSFGSLPDRSVEVPPEREAEIRAAVEEIAGPRAVSLQMLREQLGDRFPRVEVDNTLQKLNRSGDWHVTPEVNQKALTPRTRLAAVVIGNQDKHAIRIIKRGPQAPLDEDEKLLGPALSQVTRAQRAQGIPDDKIVTDSAEAKAGMYVYSGGRFNKLVRPRTQPGKGWFVEDSNPQYLGSMPQAQVGSAVAEYNRMADQIKAVRAKAPAAKKVPAKAIKKAVPEKVTPAKVSKKAAAKATKAITAPLKPMAGKQDSGETVPEGKRDGLQVSPQRWGGYGIRDAEGKRVEADYKTEATAQRRIRELRAGDTIKTVIPQERTARQKAADEREAKRQQGLTRATEAAPTPSTSTPETLAKKATVKRAAKSTAFREPPVKAAESPAAEAAPAKKTAGMIRKRRPGVQMGDVPPAQEMDMKQREALLEKVRKAGSDKEAISILGDEAGLEVMREIARANGIDVRGMRATDIREDLVKKMRSTPRFRPLGTTSNKEATRDVIPERDASVRRTVIKRAGKAVTASEARRESALDALRGSEITGDGSASYHETLRNVQSGDWTPGRAATNLRGESKRLRREARDVRASKENLTPAQRKKMGDDLDSRAGKYEAALHNLEKSQTQESVDKRRYTESPAPAKRVRKAAPSKPLATPESNAAEDRAARETMQPFLDQAGVDFDKLSDIDKTGVMLMGLGLNDGKISRPEAARRLRSSRDGSPLHGVGEAIAAAPRTRKASIKKATPAKKAAAPELTPEQAQVEALTDEQKAAYRRLRERGIGHDTAMRGVPRDSSAIDELRRPSQPAAAPGAARGPGDSGAIERLRQPSTALQEQTRRPTITRRYSEDEKDNILRQVREAKKANPNWPVTAEDRRLQREAEGVAVARNDTAAAAQKGANAMKTSDSEIVPKKITPAMKKARAERAERYDAAVPDLPGEEGSLLRRAKKDLEAGTPATQVKQELKSRAEGFRTRAEIHEELGLETDLPGEAARLRRVADRYDKAADLAGKRIPRVKKAVKPGEKVAVKDLEDGDVAILDGKKGVFRQPKPRTTFIEFPDGSQEKVQKTRLAGMVREKRLQLLGGDHRTGTTEGAVPEAPTKAAAKAKPVIKRAAPARKVGVRKAAAKKVETGDLAEPPAKKTIIKRAAKKAEPTEKFLSPLADGTRRKTATNLKPGDKVRFNQKGSEPKEVASVERDGNQRRVNFTDGTSSVNNSNTVYWMVDEKAPRVRPIGDVVDLNERRAAKKAGIKKAAPAVKKAAPTKRATKKALPQIPDGVNTGMIDRLSDDELDTIARDAGLKSPQGGSSREKFQDLIRQVVQNEMDSRAAKKAGAKKATKVAAPDRPTRGAVSAQRASERQQKYGPGGPSHIDLSKIGDTKGLDLGDEQTDLDNGKTPAQVAKKLDFRARGEKNSAAIIDGGWDDQANRRRLAEDPEYYGPLLEEQRRRYEAGIARGDRLKELADKLRGTRRPIARKAAPAKATPAKKAVPEIPAAKAAPGRPTITRAKKAAPVKKVVPAASTTKEVAPPRSREELDKLSRTQLRDLLPEGTTLGPRTSKNDLVEALVGNEPDGEHHVSETPRIKALREAVEAGTVDKKILGGGEDGGNTNRVVQIQSGDKQLVRKRMKQDWHLDPERQADAERITSRFAEEIDADAPASYQPTKDTVFQEHVDGTLASRLSAEELRAKLDTPEGRRIYLMDLITGNPDRHAGNLIVEKGTGKIKAIDHGMNFADGFDDKGPDGDIRPVPSSAHDPFRTLFAATKGTYTRGGKARDDYQWADGVPFTRKEVMDARRALVRMRPEFTRSGRQEWYKNALARTDALLKRAKPDERRQRPTIKRAGKKVSPRVATQRVKRSEKSRTQRPDGYPERKVNAGKESPNVDDPDYTPTPFTADVTYENDETLRPEGNTDPTKYWADPPDVKKVKRQFRSYEGEVALDDQGRPVNPYTRTGITERGELGKWGANFAGDPILTRVDPETGRLQMLAITRKNGEEGIPGGMVDFNEDIFRTLRRELKEETGLDIDFDTAKKVYQGYVDDPRNTDNAWMETSAFHKHLSAAEAAKAAEGKFKPHDSDEIKGVRWADIDRPLLDKLYASHGDFVRTAVKDMLSDESLSPDEKRRLRSAISTRAIKKAAAPKVLTKTETKDLPDQPDAPAVPVKAVKRAVPERPERPVKVTRAAKKAAPEAPTKKAEPEAPATKKAVPAAKTQEATPERPVKVTRAAAKKATPVKEKSTKDVLDENSVGSTVAKNNVKDARRDLDRGDSPSDVAEALRDKAHSLLSGDPLTSDDMPDRLHHSNEDMHDISHADARNLNRMADELDRTAGSNPSKGERREARRSARKSTPAKKAAPTPAPRPDVDANKPAAELTDRQRNELSRLTPAQRSGYGKLSDSEKDTYWRSRLGGMRRPHGQAMKDARYNTKIEGLLKELDEAESYDAAHKAMKKYTDNDLRSVYGRGGRSGASYMDRERLESAVVNVHIGKKAREKGVADRKEREARERAVSSLIGDYNDDKIGKPELIDELRKVNSPQSNEIADALASDKTPDLAPDNRIKVGDRIIGLDGKEHTVAKIEDRFGDNVFVDENDREIWRGPRGRSFVTRVNEARRPEATETPSKPTVRRPRAPAASTIEKNLLDAEGPGRRRQILDSMDDLTVTQWRGLATRLGITGHGRDDKNGIKDRIERHFQRGGVGTPKKSLRDELRDADVSMVPSQGRHDFHGETIERATRDVPGDDSQALRERATRFDNDARTSRSLADMVEANLDSRTAGERPAQEKRIRDLRDGADEYDKAAKVFRRRADRIEKAQSAANRSRTPEPERRAPDVVPTKPESTTPAPTAGATTRSRTKFSASQTAMLRRLNEGHIDSDSDLSTQEKRDLNRLTTHGLTRRDTVKRDGKTVFRTSLTDDGRKELAKIDRPAPAKKAAPAEKVTPPAARALPTVDESEALRGDPKGDNMRMHGDSVTMNLAQDYARVGRNGSANRMMDLRRKATTRDPKDGLTPQEVVDELHKIRAVETDPTFQRKLDSAIEKIDAPMREIPELPANTPPEARRLIQQLNEIPHARKRDGERMGGGSIHGPSLVDQVAQVYRDAAAGKRGDEGRSPSDRVRMILRNKTHEVNEGSFRIWDLAKTLDSVETPQGNKPSPLTSELRAFERGQLPDVPTASAPEVKKVLAQADDLGPDADKVRVTSARDRLDGRQKEARIRKARGAMDLATELLPTAQAFENNPEGFRALIRRQLSGDVPGDLSNPRDTRAAGYDALRKAMGPESTWNTPEKFNAKIRKALEGMGVSVDHEPREVVKFNPDTMEGFDGAKLSPGDNVLVVRSGLTYRDKDGTAHPLVLPKVTPFRGDGGGGSSGPLASGPNGPTAPDVRPMGAVTARRTRAPGVPGTTSPSAPKVLTGRQTTNDLNAVGGNVDTSPDGIPIRDFQLRSVDPTISPGEGGGYRIQHGTYFRREGVPYLVEHADTPGGRAEAKKVQRALSAHRESLPPSVQGHARGYTWLTGKNPEDEVFSREQGLPPGQEFVSEAVSDGLGGTYLFNRDRFGAAGLGGALDHEFAHTLDTAQTGTSRESRSVRWKDSAKSDALHRESLDDVKILRGNRSGGKNMVRLRAAVPSDAVRFPYGVSDYGTSSDHENFPEMFRLYHLGPIGTARLTPGGPAEPIWARDLFPEQAGIMDEMMPDFAQKQLAEIAKVRSASAMRRLPAMRKLIAEHDSSPRSKALLDLAPPAMRPIGLVRTDAEKREIEQLIRGESTSDTPNVHVEDGVMTGRVNVLDNVNELLKEDTGVRGLAVRDLELQNLGGYKMKSGHIWRMDGVTYLLENGGTPAEQRQLMDTLFEEHSSLPPSAREFQKGYVALRGADPFDEYMAAQERIESRRTGKPLPKNTMRTIAGAMAGDTMVYGLGDRPIGEQLTSVKKSIRHESGHNFDTALGSKAGLPGGKLSTGPEWLAAAQAEPPRRAYDFTPGEQAPLSAIQWDLDPNSKFVGGVTKYGTSSPEEDFAESISMYFGGQIGTGSLTNGGQAVPLWFRDLWPERARVLDKYFADFAEQQQAEISRARG